MKFYNKVIESTIKSSMDFKNTSKISLILYKVSAGNFCIHLITDTKTFKMYTQYEKKKKQIEKNVYKPSAKDFHWASLLAGKKLIKIDFLKIYLE